MPAGRRSSEAARLAARCAGIANSAENNGRAGLSPYTSIVPDSVRLNATKPSAAVGPLSRMAACTAAAENVKAATAMPASLKSW